MKTYSPILLLVLLAACSKEEASAPIYDTAAVERASISVSVGSAGVVEPLATVEVKSKASGEVLELLIETGDSVAAGDLLVRIDPRTVRNQLAQAEAELKAARSRRTRGGSGPTPPRTAGRPWTRARWTASGACGC